VNHLLAYGGFGARSFRRFLIRQGLDVLTDNAYLEAQGFGSSNSATYGGHIRISPNKQHAIICNGNSSTAANNGFTVFPDVTDFSTNYTPAATFAALVNAVACSDTHYAVGGNAPYLYIWDWATNSLQSASTTGLGNVTGLAFSPDQTKLLVSHSVTPFMRVYNVADWTYTNAVTAPGSGRQWCAWTPDGTSAVCTGTGSPYLCSYTPNLATRNTALTSALYNADSWGGAMRHPTKPKALICWNGYSTNTTASHLYEYDFATGTKTDIIPNTTNTYCSHAVYDPTNNVIIAITGSAANGGIVTQFDATTYAVKNPIDKELTYLINSQYTSLAVLAREMTQITGSVRDINNNPAAREVDVYQRSSGILVARTMSEAVTGNYVANLPFDDTFDVQFKIASGELLNDLFFARATPAAV
jgi:hypothetical protein